MTSGDDFSGRGRGARRKEKVVDLARFMMQRDGGELEDFMAEAERSTPYEPRQYRDDDLVHNGFRIDKAYDYTDPGGRLLNQVVRYAHPNLPGEKQFRQRRPGTNVDWLADAGLVKVPYRWPELINRPDETVYFTEGEKDADTLAENGLLATTAAGQKWSSTIVDALTDRNVVILEDNDDKGRENAEKARDYLRPVARSVRVVRLPGLRHKEDVTDWLKKRGGTIEQLKAISEKTRPAGISATPAPWIDPKTIPPRDWLYKPSYIRQFVSVLISTGGAGKSSLVIVEVVAMLTGKPLLGISPTHPLRVWYWNGEDPSPSYS